MQIKIFRLEKSRVVISNTIRNEDICDWVVCIRCSARTKTQLNGDNENELNENF